MITQSMAAGFNKESDYIHYMNMKYHSQDEGINFRDRDEKWKPI